MVSWWILRKFFPQNSHILFCKFPFKFNAILWRKLHKKKLMLFRPKISPQVDTTLFETFHYN